MATALNMTMKLKQDANQAKLMGWGGLRPEGPTGHRCACTTIAVVHYARAGHRQPMHQVITEFGGDGEVYTEFFERPSPTFKAIFELVEGAPTWEE